MRVDEVEVRGLAVDVARQLVEEEEQAEERFGSLLRGEGVCFRDFGEEGGGQNGRRGALGGVRFEGRQGQVRRPQGVEGGEEVVGAGFVESCFLRWRCVETPPALEDGGVGDAGEVGGEVGEPEGADAGVEVVVEEGFVEVVVLRW